MKILPLLFLLTVPFNSCVADVRMLEDSELSDLSGQAGLLVDTYLVDTQVKEFEYVDASIADLNIIQVGGHGESAHANPFYTDKLDNIKIDVNQLNPSATHAEGGFYYGFSKFRDMAELYLANGNRASEEAFIALADGQDSKRNFLAVDDKKKYAEGDLVIHYNYLDAWEKDGGLQAFSEGKGLSGLDFTDISYDQAEQLASKAIDFSYVINEIGLNYGGLGSFSEKPFRSR